VNWLVKPDGSRFFSLGVCVVNTGATRETFTRTNPGYAGYQHYGNSYRWAEATLKRLKSWKFTTIGGWSEFESLKKCRETGVASIPVLSVGMTSSVQWRDM